MDTTESRTNIADSKDEYRNEKVIEKSDDITNGFPMWYRLSKSTVLVLVWIAMGMFNQITSTAMDDLLDRVNSPKESISTSLAIMNMGKAVGSIGGGLLMDRLVRHDDAIMSVALLVASLTVVIKPWSVYVEILGASFALQGLMHGLINNAGNAMQIRMWDKKSNPPLFLMHMGYPIGMFLAPLIARPYLGPDKDEDFNNTTMTTPTSSLAGLHDSTFGTNSTIAESVTSRIEIPYFIISAVVLFMALMFFILYCSKPKIAVSVSDSQKLSFRNLLNPGSCAEGKHVFGASICCMLALFYFGLKNKDEPMNYYLFTFAVTSSLQFSKQEAALLDSMQGLGQSIGRLLSAIIRLCIPIQVMMMVYLFAILGTMIAFYFLAFEGRVYIWVLTILFNAFSGPLWPGAIAWTDRYIQVTGLVIGVADIGNGLGGFASQWLVGHLLANYEPIYIVYCSLGASAAMCVWLVLMQIVGSYNGDRYIRAKREMHSAVNNGMDVVVDEMKDDKTTRL